jgi:hypothetical protein
VTTPADELRTAAQKIRDLGSSVEVNDQPDLPWHVEECADDERGNCPCIVAQGRYSYHDEPSRPMFYVADAETPECAAYIAAMHPGVGALLAELLNTAAEYANTEAVAHPTHLTRALAVARAINGGQP